MRKSLFILLQIIMFAMPLFAERVDEKTAQKVAETFLKNKGVEFSDMTSADVMSKGEFRNFYVFNASEGFVIVSADDCVLPVLAYSKTGRFVVDDTPENISYWLSDYDRQIQEAIESGMRPSVEIVSLWKDLMSGKPNAAKSDVVVDALIQTTWDQGAPYNNLCPLALNGNGQYEHCVTGCVATAMAQVIKFWNHPAVGLSWNSYYPNNGNPTYYGTVLGLQEVYFYNTHYDWNHMPNAPTTSSPDIEQNAVATLMYHCGVAVNMMYDISAVGGSGAYSDDVPAALKNYFNYKSSLVGRYRSNYSEANWKNLLKADLDAHRPIYYSGSGSGGGHAFVCDGYDSDDYFHFNWGWGGHCDGFYAITNLAPGAGGIGSGSTGSYNNYNYAIFGIEPNFASINPPTGLVATLDGRNVNLSWNAATGISTYNVYRNNVLIAHAVSGTSYTDVHIPYGSNRYCIRSIDSENNLSESSNEETITIVFPAPLNLAGQINIDESATLSWTASSPIAVAYNVYCNGALVGTSNTTSYTHALAPFGNASYFVRGVDSYGDESLQSDVVNLTHVFSGPVVTNLTATPSDNNVSLSWTAPAKETGNLHYGTTPHFIAGFSEPHETYWAQKYPAEKLAQYAGMAITSVSNYFFPEAYTLTIGKIVNGAITQLYSGSFTVQSQGPVLIDIPNIVMDYTCDLWIQFKAPATVERPLVYDDYSGQGAENAAYYSSNGDSWNILEGSSWPFEITISDDTYSYNLYRDDNVIAQNISNTTYNDNGLDDGYYRYHVTTNYYGNVSAPSNVAMATVGNSNYFYQDGDWNTAANWSRNSVPASNDNAVIDANAEISGDAAVGDLTINNGKSLVVDAGRLLTVGGTFVNNAQVSGFVLNDGAQLIHSTSGVQATVQKNITGYGMGEGNWYLIASPMASNVSANPFVSENYDLYCYNEPTHYWWNAEGTDHAFDALSNGKGYLYASQANQLVSLPGELQPSGQYVSIPLSYTSSLTTLRGFNLVGNPFPCKAMLMGDNIAADFYVMNVDRDELVMSQGIVVNPFEGIFVEATSPESVAKFYRWNPDYRGNAVSSYFDITVNEDRSEIDRARVRMGEGKGLGKFSLNENSTRIYIPIEKQDYASAYVSGQNVLPLNFEPAKNGSYTLHFDLKNVDLAYLHLIDNLTGADVDILAASEGYTFDAKTSDYPSRFKLVFAEKNQPNESDDSNFMYYADGQLFVFGGEENGTVQIVDVTGRVVLNEDVNGFSSKSVSLKPGVYVAHMICGEVVKSQKFVAE